jgi:hypothetical protein
MNSVPRDEIENLEYCSEEGESIKSSIAPPLSISVDATDIQLIELKKRENFETPSSNSGAGILI